MTIIIKIKKLIGIIKVYSIWQYNLFFLIILESNKLYKKYIHFIGFLFTKIAQMKYQGG